jgi:hypothetical protein
VIKNTVPKQWVDYDIYCQLLPNDDPNNEYYQCIPRTGAFEVSHKGVVRIALFTLKLVFSKLMSGLWPNFESVSERVAECVNAAKNGEDYKRFQTTGTGIPVKKQTRRTSPNKTN